MKTSFVLIAMMIMFTVGAFAQDAPSGYTTMGLRKWSSGARPSADSLNANWTLADSLIRLRGIQFIILPYDSTTGKWAGVDSLTALSSGVVPIPRAGAVTRLMVCFGNNTVSYDDLTYSTSGYGYFTVAQKLGIEYDGTDVRVYNNGNTIAGLTLSYTLAKPIMAVIVFEPAY